jgi:hypothetical protein
MVFLKGEDYAHCKKKHTSRFSGADEDKSYYK